MKIYFCIKFFFLGIVVSTFISCKCKDNFCPGLDSKYVSYFNVTEGDSIKFINSTGNRMSFQVKFREITESKITECGPNGLLGCSCVGCGDISGFYGAFTKDSSRFQTDSLGKILPAHINLGSGIRILEKNYLDIDTVRLRYGILDHENTITINPVLKLYSNDSLLSNFSVGGNNYNNVIMHKTDTTKTPQAYLYVPRLKFKFYVTKSYFNKEKGIIAFFDNFTNSLFYRVY